MEKFDVQGRGSGVDYAWHYDCWYSGSGSDQRSSALCSRNDVDSMGRHWRVFGRDPIFFHDRKADYVDI